MGIFKIQECFVPQKSIFDLFGKKLPARRVTVKHFEGISVYLYCQSIIHVFLYYRQSIRIFGFRCPDSNVLLHGNRSLLVLHLTVYPFVYSILQFLFWEAVDLRYKVSV